MQNYHPVRNIPLFGTLSQTMRENSPKVTCLRYGEKLQQYWKNENKLLGVIFFLKTNCKTSPTFKKAQKCKYLPAELRKIIEMKNKKVPNHVSLHFYINVIAKKQPPTQYLRKTAKMTKKNFSDAAELSKQLKNPTIRCVLISSIFYICILADINMHVYAQFSIL